MKLNNNIKAVLKSTALSGLAKSVLLCLLENGQKTPRMLAEELNVNPERILEALRELVSSGLAFRTDKRLDLQQTPEKTRVANRTGPC